VVLKPGEKAILEKSSKTLVVTPDAGNHASWREDILVFDNLSLVEISRLLERRFNVKIQIKKEKIRNIRYSGKFTSDEGLSEVLDIIRETSPVKFNYKHNKEEIIIE
jgi:ferric-dicitrate binding protein FerR (iron transport regulator)